MACRVRIASSLLCRVAAPDKTGTQGAMVGGTSLRHGVLLLRRLSAAPPLPACGGLLPVTRHQEPVMPVGTTSSGSRPAAGRSHCQPPSRRSACEAGGGSRGETQARGGISGCAVGKIVLGF